MKKAQPKNMAASAKQRLLNLARERKEDFNFLLIRYGIERFLYRFSKSKYAGDFVLKGSMLFHLWSKAPYRPTKDVDFLGRGNPDPARMEQVFRQICKVSIEDDGLVFMDKSIRADRIRVEAEYSAIRIHLEARLGSARIRLQVDIGFGDQIIPRPKKKKLPGLLDFDSPRLLVSPWETVVAEKYHALVSLGMATSGNQTCGRGALWSGHRGTAIWIFP